eukprot:c28661_g1_i1 orf=1-666(-)
MDGAPPFLKHLVDLPMSLICVHNMDSIASNYFCNHFLSLVPKLVDTIPCQVYSHIIKHSETYKPCHPNNKWINAKDYMTNYTLPSSIPCLQLSHEICVTKTHNIIYTDGSVIQDKAGYGVFSPTIPLFLSQRLAGPQTILRVELMAILVAIQNIPQHWKSSQICSDSRTSLLLLSKYLRHPSRIIDHPDIDLIKKIIACIQNTRTHIYLAKVRAHIGISGNE